MVHFTLLAWGSGRVVVRVVDWLLADRRILVVWSKEVALWKDSLGRSEGLGTSAAADSLTISILCRRLACGGSTALWSGWSGRAEAPSTSGVLLSMGVFYITCGESRKNSSSSISSSSNSIITGVVIEIDYIIDGHKT